MPDIKLCYVIIFRDGTVIDTIRVEDSLDFAKVCRKIYEEHKIAFQRQSIDRGDIDIYTPPELNAAPNNTLVDRVKTSVEGSDPTSPLDEVSSISSILNPQEKLVHLVLVARPPAITGPQHDAGTPVEDPEVVKLYRDIIIQVHKWGDYTELDVIQNEIKANTEISVPRFVAEFEEKLDSNPGLAPDMLEALKVILGDQYQAAYFGSLINSNAAEEQSGARAAGGEETAEAEDEDHNNRRQPWRQADRLELMHIAEIASENWQEFWTGPFGKALEEDIADVIFFLRLMLHIPDGPISAQKYVRP
ncbi:uncharacterized protein LAESUDRAFT_107131 [Laetiporus sulphureus 93-53]|uniref:Uncharacterized protein n=1 Tax=Laetiporus sulphureus 93-53 TaxID=1314785 RepID=A0A165EV03_9APHY|nr:uncharacterized protein LAESUDRAFT_107131 [Laetiporus sulphureus 93-53]KZT07817.1 hypothetical protein LAESUDRAFT_107131 [Laetiporus sulphureus 93-53]